MSDIETIQHGMLLDFWTAIKDLETPCRCDDPFDRMVGVMDADNRVLHQLHISAW
jgi:hypothetical protein